MNLLAIDTSSDACSVALQFDGEVLENHVVEPREHMRILMPMITAVLAGRALGQLDAIVLGNGPGSFIGMRIGASVAQGLCYGAGLPIVAVSSLAAVAAEVFAGGSAGPVLVAQDARMGEVYLGCYDLDAARNPVLGGREGIVVADGTLPVDRPFIAAGYGWERYPALVTAAGDLVVGLADVRYPRARFLLEPGRAQVQQGRAMAPEKLVPAYLRSKVADVPGKG